MEDLVSDNIETPSAQVVKRAARDFAVALTETLQFKTFGQADERFRDDPAAEQEAVDFLREINTEIDQLRGLSCAMLANHATC